MKVREKFFVISTLIVLIVFSISIFWKSILWSFVIIGPLVIMGLIDVFQKKQAIRRNFPVIGRLRYVLESIRPEIMQYFVETDTQGRPINRIFRTLIYQRSKKVNDTTPFGTQVDVYRAGYEWMDHSLYIKNGYNNHEFPKVKIGGNDCKKPYDASLLNISAMSFGSLSKNAIMALNKGAKKGNFAHNTGEGGISPYHLKYGGDLIWQIGTAYFGCRTESGNFCPDTFQKAVSNEVVKMIEIKLSQGAKPGHGGVLPAIKNTKEIANIRHVKPHSDVLSPPSHSSFSDAKGLLEFIVQLRDLSGGKPVGFKLCVGKKQEFIDIAKAMVTTGIRPDFITVDGGEGGTGAAPVEFTNSIGMPLREGIVFVHDTLVGFDLKNEIKIIASGKIFSGFHMIRAKALGADLCNSARAMLLSVGCIQARECNINTCPTGVATQNKSLMKGLVVEDKYDRVTNYHEETIHSFLEMIAAAGLKSHEEIDRKHVNRRIGMHTIEKYNQIYPPLDKGCLLNKETIPASYQDFFMEKEMLIN